MSSFGFSLIEQLFPILFILMFVLVFGTIVVTMVRGVVQWGRNNASPEISADATIVSKREAFHRSNHHGYTTYYVTFEMEDGSRMELTVAGREYGQMREGDYGQLIFQGTRFKSFRRV